MSPRCGRNPNQSFAIHEAIRIVATPKWPRSPWHRGNFQMAVNWIFNGPANAEMLLDVIKAFSNVGCGCGGMRATTDITITLARTVTRSTNNQGDVAMKLVHTAKRANN